MPCWRRIITVFNSCYSILDTYWQEKPSNIIWPYSANLPSAAWYEQLIDVTFVVIHSGTGGWQYFILIQWPPANGGNDVIPNCLPCWTFDDLQMIRYWPEMIPSRWVLPRSVMILLRRWWWLPVVALYWLTVPRHAYWPHCDHSPLMNLTDWTVPTILTPQPDGIYSFASARLYACLHYCYLLLLNIYSAVGIVLLIYCSAATWPAV